MICKQRYGDEAGKATGTAVQSVINVGVAAYNFDDLAFKAIMKTTGKATAKAMVKKPGRGERSEEGRGRRCGENE